MDLAVLYARAVRELETDTDEVVRLVAASKASLATGIAEWQAGRLVEGARAVSLACSLEFEAMGSCDSCGAIESELHREHVGSDADLCEFVGCSVCTEFERTSRQDESISDALARLAPKETGPADCEDARNHGAVLPGRWCSSCGWRSPVRSLGFYVSVWGPGFSRIEGRASTEDEGAHLGEQRARMLSQWHRAECTWQVHDSATDTIVREGRVFSGP